MNSHLECEGGVLHGDVFVEELHAERVERVLLESVANVPRHEAGLPDAAVAQQDNLDYVVAQRTDWPRRRRPTFAHFSQPSTIHATKKKKRSLGRRKITCG